MKTLVKQDGWNRHWARVWQFAAVLATLAAAVPAPAADDAPGGSEPAAVEAPVVETLAGEQPGRGWQLGDTGIGIGGYGELVADDALGRSATGALDSLSLFVWWQTASRWSAFVEAELEDAVFLGPREQHFDDTELVLERLHVDYAWSDALQLRVGKFLTPIGRWNVIHAPPLTWTTSRPLITESTFPTNATGGMVHGVVPVGGRALEWSLYASPGEELAPEDELDTFKQAYGLRLDYTLMPNLQLGSSIVSFEQRAERGERKRLYGIDFLWSWRGAELSGEFAYRALDRDKKRADEQGHYLQAVLPVWRPLYAVARYEGFDPAGSGEGLHLYVGGLSWRFAPGTALKLEYRYATDNGVQVPEGWLASFAVLF